MKKNHELKNVFILIPNLFETIVHHVQQFNVL